MYIATGWTAGLILKDFTQPGISKVPCIRMYVDRLTLSGNITSQGQTNIYKMIFMLFWFGARGGRCDFSHPNVRVFVYPISVLPLHSLMYLCDGQSLCCVMMRYLGVHISHSCS